MSYLIENARTGEVRSIGFTEGRALIEADPSWQWATERKYLHASLRPRGPEADIDPASGFRRDRSARSVHDGTPGAGDGRPDTSQPLKSNDARDECGFPIANAKAMADHTAAHVAPRVLGTVRTYPELVEALRARSDSLGLTREQLDQIGGLAGGYSGKILGRGHVKKLGRMSFETMLEALGLALQVVEDGKGMAATRRRIDATHLKRQKAAADAE